MKCEWKCYTIKDLCTKICSGGTPSSRKPEYYEGGIIPWLNTKEINFGQITDTEKSITELGLKNSSAKWIKENCVIVAMYGATAGKVAINKIPLTTNQACCNLELNPELADFRYIYYYLKYHYQQLSSLANGGAQQNLSAKVISDYQVWIPCVEYQRDISSILGVLDDKIELNNRINANLQQQAFCIFDQLLTEISGESVPISDIAYLNPKRALTKNQIAKCIDMAQLSTTGAFPDGWVDKPFKGGMRFTNGDTLLARITPCLENGKTAFIDFLNESEVAFGSTEYIVLSPKEGIPPEFLYCLARYPVFVDYAVKNMNGSSGRQRVSAETIGQYSLPRLSEEQYQKFGKLVSPLFRKMKYNWMENMRLAEVRDTLLPKLMDHEIVVSNFERSYGEK